jgi:hypothetical protein
VGHAQGCGFGEGSEANESAIAEAVSLAAKADVALLFLGLHTDGNIFQTPPR